MNALLDTTAQINAYLTGETVAYDDLMKAIRQKPHEDRVTLFQQLRARNPRDEETWQRLATLLLDVGHHVAFEQPSTFTLLAHAWANLTRHTGFGQQMVSSLRELTPKLR